MTLLSTLTTGAATAKEIAADAIESVDDMLQLSLAARNRRDLAERQEIEQREREKLQAHREAENARVVAYLAQPRRMVEEIQASITSTQAESVALAQQLADLETAAIQSDEPVSTKDATRHSQLTLNIKSIGGRLERLSAELADAQRAAFLQSAQDTIQEYLQRAEALLAYEKDEFAELEARYIAAMEHRRKERHYLQYALMGLFDELRRTDHSLIAEVEALKAPHPATHTTWRQV